VSSSPTRIPLQIPLPFQTTSSFTRDNFIVSPANAHAVAFVDSWPTWTIAVAVLYGPSGSGKSHLTRIWQDKASAQTVLAAAISGSAFGSLDRTRPIVLEDVDSSLPNPARDTAIFHLVEAATTTEPLLLTGRHPPSTWPTILPDLASRFSALVSFSLWAPDDELLARLAGKLFEDRQVKVPDAVIMKMLRLLERSPSAVRAFVARADDKALAEGRPISLALVRDMLDSQDVDEAP